MFFHPKNLKSENNNLWFKPWFNILLLTQSIVCATVDSQCLEYLRYITLDFMSNFLVVVVLCPMRTRTLVLSTWFSKNLQPCLSSLRKRSSPRRPTKPHKSISSHLQLYPFYHQSWKPQENITSKTCFLISVRRK